MKQWLPRLQRLEQWIYTHSLIDHPLRAYILTLIFMAIALSVRLLIAPVSHGLQYVTFFPAVTLAAVMGGWRAGMLATGIGLFLATWIFTPPYWELDWDSIVRSFWSNLVFMMDGCIVSFSIESMHRYRRHYQTELKESQQAEHQTAELNKQLKRLVVQHEEDAVGLQKFMAIIDSTDDAIISKSLDGIITSWNLGAEKIFGYQAAEVIGKSMITLIPPDRFHEEAEILKRIAAGERIGHFETERVCKDGRRIWISASMSPIVDGKGKVVGVSKIARDITHQKLVEHQIDMFFELSLDMMCISSSDGYFKRINPGFTQALGWSKEELLAKSYLEFIHPEDMEATRQAVQLQISRGERVLYFENRYRHQNGTWRTLSWISAPGPDGLMFATARDVTDAKHQEEALRDSAARIRSILDSVADGIITINENGIVESYNPAATKLFDYPADEVIGRNVSMLMPEPYQSEHDAYLSRYMSTSVGHVLGAGMSGGREVVGQRKDGSTFPMSLAVNEMWLGKKRYFTGIVHDITERKMVENALRASKEEAEQAGRIKASFLASMSHEIRTPLGGMLGMLELLSLSKLDHEQMATLDTAWASGRGLLRIVNDILDWSKIEEGQLHISPAPTSLVALLQDVVNTYSRVSSAKSLMLWRHVDPRLSGAYLVDPLRLSQVLNNFVSNAIKFTDRGEVEIRAELLEETPQGDKIRFSVKDTGIGIAREDQSRIFQSYAQVSADTARMYGGTGLGLAICNRLTEMMQGTLELVSEVNRGSTFSIVLTLPRTESVVELIVPHQTEEAQRAIQPLFMNEQDAPLVLVVDDHPTNRELLARQVKILGLRVKTAETGRVAVSLWRDGRFAMIISDCHMPDMDGYEMARIIRKFEALEHRERTPIIAWTANALSEEQQRIYAAGMDELLVKPVNLLQLRRMLSRWLLPTDEQSLESSRAEARPTEKVMRSEELSGSGFIPTTESEAKQPSPIDPSVLDAIMTAPAEQKQLLLDFVQHMIRDRESLTALLAQQNSAALQSAAHRMKGSCRMVGAVQLAETCAEMERAAKAGDLPRAQALLVPMDVAMQAVVRYVG